MAIYVLDQHTAELIAAGEVVERPASVVKELVENAIDASAANITVEIERGGISLIRVQDDGGGIDAEDIPTAFLRHATSKVRTQEDLEAISTLGFRGEALASIASVSQIQLLTKTPQDEFASEYSIHGGKELGLVPGARPVGTTVSVQNLFYNTPARMKFLKKDASEGTFVSETVTRLALSHPDIAFRFIRDGKQVFSSPGDGRLDSVVYAVLGASFSRDLVAVDGKEGRYSVSGLITPPRSGRASRSMQFFFINGRFVKNRSIMAALEQAYRGTMMQGKFPGGVLFLQMPPDMVDVNVHPAKTEVRFAREGDVFDAVYKACKAALTGGFSVHSSLEVSPHGGQPEAGEGTQQAQEDSTVKAPFIKPEPLQSGNCTPGAAGGEIPPTQSKIQAYNKLVDTLASSSTMAPYQLSKEVGKTSYAAPATEWGLLIEGEEDEPVEANKKTEPLPAVEQTEIELSSALPGVDMRLIGEVFKTYILAEMGSTLCLIDKHAAHERMLYEQLMAARGKTAAQQLLAPLPVVMSAAEKNALLHNEQVLADAGFDLDDFGGNEVLVRAVPADVEPASIEDLVLEVAQRLVLNSKDAMNEKTEWVLHSVACRAAVKAGDKTTPQELLELAAKILDGSVPPYCPHGRPVVLEITRKELEKQFGRLG